ncbi:hypothetical protein ACIBAI_20315 [Streptomyces sp. NPDC051041]|uniref:hypothetical protein n=1 Tax=Streptomyces sp. NPDC051041 TaxID=3365640 RepID=UPI0037989171
MMLAASLSVSSCQSGDDQGSANPGKVRENDCLGTLNEAATKAAASLLGSESYVTSSSRDGATGAAKEIVSEYRTNGITGGNEVGICWIYRSKKDVSDLTISSSFATEIPKSSTVASVFTPFKMGEIALAGNREAVVYMQCSSRRFETDGSQETFTLRVEASNRYEPDGSPVELQEKNLTVAHSASLALAKALDCKNNGGLTSEFRMPSRL